MQRMATRIGAPGRLTVSSGDLQIFRAAPGIVAFAPEEASGSPNLRVRSRVLRRLSSPGLAWKKVEAAPGRFRRLPEARLASSRVRAACRIFERLREPCLAPWNLEAALRIRERAPEGSGGAQNSGTRLRSLERLSDPCSEAPKVPGFCRTLERTFESSRAFRSLPSHVSRFPAPFELSGLHPTLPRAGEVLAAAPEGSGGLSNLLRRIQGFGEATFSSIPL